MQRQCGASDMSGGFEHGTTFEGVSRVAGQHVSTQKVVVRCREPGHSQRKGYVGTRESLNETLLLLNANGTQHKTSRGKHHAYSELSFPPLQYTLRFANK